MICIKSLGYDSTQIIFSLRLCLDVALEGPKNKQTNKQINKQTNGGGGAKKRPAERKEEHTCGNPVRRASKTYAKKKKT